MTESLLRRSSRSSGYWVGMVRTLMARAWLEKPEGPLCKNHVNMKESREHLSEHLRGLLPPPRDISRTSFPHPVFTSTSSEPPPYTWPTSVVLVLGVARFERRPLLGYQHMIRLFTEVRAWLWRSLQGFAFSVTQRTHVDRSFHTVEDNH